MQWQIGILGTVSAFAFDDGDDDIYSTAIGCIPGGSATRLQTKMTYNKTVNTNNTYSKPFTLHWADVSVRTVPRL